MLVGGMASAELAQPFNLRCEYRVNPLGIDSAQPRLSWNLNSSQRNQIQSGYQVLVATTAEKLTHDAGDLWDSGKVESGASIQIAYAGKTLGSHAECFWKVRSWDRDGNASPWSETASWTMGVLDKSDWSGARWIGLDEGEAGGSVMDALKSAHWIWSDEDAPQSSAPIGERFFRTTFELSDKSIISASGLLAVDNEAAVFVNGVRIGDCNSFEDANEFTFPELLHSGKNIVAVKAANAGESPNPAGLLAAFRIEQASSAPVIFTTSENWKVSSDASADWEKDSFDDSSWKSSKELGKYGMDPWKDTGANMGRVLPVRMLRKEFEADQPVRRAVAYLSGLGLSELYVNGAKAGNAVLSPGCTEYEKRVFYVTYDVTNQIQSGKNALGVMLGNGRFYAPRIQEPTATKTYNYPRMLMMVRLEMADGSIREVVSDDSWKLSIDGPIRANNEYDGETYDATREKTGWDKPGFNDAAWRAVAFVDAPKGEVCAQMSEPIRISETIHPIGMTNPKPGVYVYDMGQNMVGWCKLTVSGSRGMTVQLRHAETLLDDGSIYLANIRGAKVTDRYTIKGEGVETYEPRFTYHGFRYVEMTGFPGVPTLDAIEGKVVHDDVKPAGSFNSSSTMLNKLACNIRWGTRGNYRSMPTDCPQRDERQGWLGDRSEECRGESYMFDIAPLYSKWVCDMADAQLDNGSVSDVCPAYWPLYGDDVTWPSTFIIAPGMLYEQYGDTRVLERHYDAMKKWIDHMATYVKDGIIDKDNYGDWCVPPEEQHLIHSKDPARKTAGDFLATAYLYRDYCLMAQYAEIIAKPKDAATFRDSAESIKAAFNAKYLDVAGKKYSNGTETSCVLPLAFGLVPR
jgi:alpha-L-rhamnosidase